MNAVEEHITVKVMQLVTTRRVAMNVCATVATLEMDLHAQVSISKFLPCHLLTVAGIPLCRC